VLRAAAAVAADEPVPRAAEAPYRYTKIRERSIHAFFQGEATASHTMERLGEAWVGARWRGREVHAQGRFRSSGDPGLARATSRDMEARAEPREGPYAYGDGPLAELDPTTLPATRDAIAATLRDGIRFDRWGPYPESRGKDSGLAGGADRSYTAHALINLLVYARLTPQQRAALLDVFAGDPAARDVGTVKDSEGREGRGVALEYDARAGAEPRAPTRSSSIRTRRRSSSGR
jgi:hypothetical protein